MLAFSLGFLTAASLCVCLYFWLPKATKNTPFSGVLMRPLGTKKRRVVSRTEAEEADLEEKADLERAARGLDVI